MQVHRRFCDDTSCVTAWFDTFSMEGMQHFGPGARALANYCLRERASVWSCLQWKRRPVAPVTATRRPVLFCELAVVPTIKQLLREDPHFLLSRDLTDACRCAAWISCNTPFFAQVCTQHCNLCFAVCSTHALGQLSHTDSMAAGS